MNIKNWICCLLVTSTVLVSPFQSRAQSLPPLPPLPAGRVLNVWLFQDTNWNSFVGSVPLAHTNLSLANDWTGGGLLLDATNEAFLNYSVFEANGTTNMNFANGSIEFWFAPDWNSSDQIGNWGTLIEAGSWNTNLAATAGAWGLYLSPDGSNVLFSAQTNGYSTNYLFAPISWNADEFHHIALTYSLTNSLLYFDGQLITNGPGISVIPADLVLSNGFSVGSDGNDTGLLQARGTFNQLITYDYALDPVAISNFYAYDSQFAYPLPGGTDYTHHATGPVFFGDSGGGSPSIPGFGSNLWLGLSVSHSLANLVIHTPDSNGVYDIFATTNLTTNVPGLNLTNWLWVMRTTNTQTNILLTNLWATAGFFRLGTMIDSDGDGLSDAFELLVSKTNPNLRDSNGNGIMDGDELSTNGLPWRLEQVRQNAAIAYANITNATEGGACGQITIYLPAPAPSGGATVQFQLGGIAALNTDYTLSSTTNSISIAANASSATINVCAVNGTTYPDLDRYMTVTLTNSTCCSVDGSPAQVNVVGTNAPGLRVFALPPWLYKPSPTFGTNSAAFYFVRDGAVTNSQTVSFTLTGTATNGSDYSTLPTSITFAAGSRTNLLPVSLIANSTSNVDSTLTLTLNAATGYQIDSSSGSATITMAAVGVPPLPTVQIFASDDDARQLGQNPGQFNFTRTGSTNDSMRVFYHVWGTATPLYTNTTGSYVPLPGYVDIPAGATNATVSVIPTNSNPTGMMETVIATLTGGGDYLIGASNAATVYIDANQTISYVASVVNNGVYGSSVHQPAQIQVTRYGSALSAATMKYTLAYNFLGNTLNSYSATGDVSGANVTWAARQNIANIYITTAWGVYSNVTVNASLNLSNSTDVLNLNVGYHPPSHMVSVSSSASPATTVTRGTSQSSALTFTRPYPDTNAFSLFFNVQGSATFGTDFTINTSTAHQVTFSGSQSSVSVPVQAFTNSPTVGWQTAVVTIDPDATGQIGITGSTRAFLRLQNPANTNSDTDMDGDGIPDGWELSNMSSGYDPQVPNNPYTDADHDGMDLVEELALGTNPNVADAQPSYPSPDPSDYMSLTMRVGESGKIPAMSCAICHEVSMRVGPFIRTCPRNRISVPVSQDYLVRLLRGTNYSVQVTADPYIVLYPQSLTTNTTPKYTATYMAQILSTSGGVYPFIMDTNNLMGTSNLMTTETLAKTATLFVPDMTIATDADRDGIVNFTNRTDRTSTNQPFTFWINDDTDNGSDNNASDLNPDLYDPDSSSTYIPNLRDLEDFTRLQFRVAGLPGGFLTNASMQICLYLTNISGTPSIRLFPAVETNGGIAYLTNTTTATSQIAATQLGLLTNGVSLTISAPHWTAAGSNQFMLPMIFEGVSTGQCVIAFGICSNGGPVLAVSRPFYLNLKSVTNIYEHWTVGDDTYTEWNLMQTIPSLVAGSASFGKPQTTNDQDYILFVHGWRMQPWERRAFANTAYKRLWHQGYKGRFGLFSWPTDWVDLGSSSFLTASFWETSLPNGTFNTGNFDRSERRAWNAGERLLELALQLNQTYPGRLRTMGHSMGNVVVAESMRRAVDRKKGEIYQTYVSLQGAIPAQCYDSNAPARDLNSIAGIDNDSGTLNVYRYFWDVPSIPATYLNDKPYLYDVGSTSGLTVNYFNVLDPALSGWRYNEDLKPDWDLPNLTYWTYSFTQGYLRNKTRLNVWSDRYEIFARAAEARCYALGAQTNVGGAFFGGATFNQLNLGAVFGFGSADSDHSGEFNSIIQNRYPFWDQILRTFDLKQ